MEVFEIAGSSTLLFLPLAHSFARIIQVGCLESGAILGHWPDTRTRGRGPARVPAHVPARRAAGVREGLQHRAAAGFGEQGEEPDLRRRRCHRRRLEPGRQLRRRRSPARRSGCGTRCSTGSSTPSSGPRSAGRWRTRCPAVPRSASGSATSSAAPASRCWRATGMTETSAAATVNRPSRNKIGTVGQPLPGVAIKIADDGEILLRGPNVFAGYWHNDAATAEVLDPEGWLRHRGRRRPGRRGLPAGHRAEEGAHRHRGRQERGAGRARGQAPRQPADQPVHGGRRRPAVHRLPDHPGRGRPGVLEASSTASSPPTRT